MGRVQVIEFRPVGSWHWMVPNEQDSCGICQEAYELACPSCSSPGDNCPLLLGECKHAFHMHCIVKWLESQAEEQEEIAQQCPLCRQPWKVLQ